jgi:hypothetical protein
MPPTVPHFFMYQQQHQQVNDNNNEERRINIVMMEGEPIGVVAPDAEKGKDNVRPKTKSPFHRPRSTWKIECCTGLIPLTFYNGDGQE